MVRGFSDQQEYISSMTVVLYIGGSKDGEKGVVPYGFSKTQADTARGREIYVERVIDVAGHGRMRIMALESLGEDLISQRLDRHCAEMPHSSAWL